MKAKYAALAVTAFLVALVAGHWLPRAARVSADSSVAVTGVVKFQDKGRQGRFVNIVATQA